MIVFLLVLIGIIRLFFLLIVSLRSLRAKPIALAKSLDFNFPATQTLSPSVGVSRSDTTAFY
jgi:hypothetical protein